MMKKDTLQLLKIANKKSIIYIYKIAWNGSKKKLL